MADDRYRILVVDDDADNVRILEEVLKIQNYDVRAALNGQEGIKLLKEWDPQLILLDMNMPGLDGLDTLKRLRNLPDHDYIAVIFLTANTSTEDMVKGLDQGADDYVCKPYQLEELLARVRAKLRIKDLHDKLKKTTKKLEELAEIDDLTGLFNMRNLYKKLDVELERARRFSKSMSCIMMDMDDFKNVNDDNDHLFGSWILTQVADVIRANTRSIDLPARYGGDEFLIILPETDLEGAVHVASRILSSITKTPFKQGEHEAQLTCSFGVAALDTSGKKGIPAKEFIRAADQMLYEAKEAGRNCVKSIQL